MKLCYPVSAIAYLPGYFCPRPFLKYWIEHVAIGDSLSASLVERKSFFFHYLYTIFNYIYMYIVIFCKILIPCFPINLDFTFNIWLYFCQILWYSGFFYFSFPQFDPSYNARCLERFRWLCPQLDYARYHCWSVNISQGNALEPSNNRPLL